MDINLACDFIIGRLDECTTSLSNLKIQKLLYYTEAWYLAFYEKSLFDEPFQAWIHGPVSLTIFQRFSDTKALYSSIEISDIRPDFKTEQLSQPIRDHILNVLDVYAPYTGYELEVMTHNEQPWIEARRGYTPDQRCEVNINQKTMQTYYAARLQDEF